MQRRDFLGLLFAPPVALLLMKEKATTVADGLLSWVDDGHCLNSFGTNYLCHGVVDYKNRLYFIDERTIAFMDQRDGLVATEVDHKAKTITVDSK